MVTCKMEVLLERLGIRAGEVAITHGFRKFFTTQLINSKVNPEIREMLLGHKIGLASCYYRPTEEEMYAEYQKAENNLTIDPTQRLQKENEMLKIEKSKADLALLQIQEMEKRLNQLSNK